MKKINDEVKELFHFFKMSGAYYKLHSNISFKSYYCNNNFSVLLSLKKQYYSVVSNRIINCTLIKNGLPGNCTVHRTDTGLYCISSKLGIFSFTDENEAINYAFSLYVLSQYNIV